MKHVLLLLAALLAGAAAGYVSATVRNAVSERPAAAAAAAPESQDAARAAVEHLERAVEDQARAIDELRMDLAARAPARASAASAAGGAPAASSAAPASERAPLPASGGADDAPFDLEAALASLTVERLDWDEREEIFERARKAGRLDEVIARMEAWAAERPEDADAQVALASAYIAKIQEVGQSPEAGRLAMQADRSYDAALAVDERHWEARFAKAMSLSFWPPVFGKQTEAIKHFEILAQQQAGLPAQDHFAQTYLMLGNTYQQVGQLDKALSAWQKGLEIFPGNEELARQIENAKSAQAGH
jgi:tetratricopeptide (TPR) repeat protein